MMAVRRLKKAKVHNYFHTFITERNFIQLLFDLLFPTYSAFPRCIFFLLFFFFLLSSLDSQMIYYIDIFACSQKLPVDKVYFSYSRLYLFFSKELSL